VYRFTRIGCDVLLSAMSVFAYLFCSSVMAGLCPPLHGLSCLFSPFSHFPVKHLLAQRAFGWVHGKAITHVACSVLTILYAYR